MKKYNLSNIMKRAWELVKKSAMTISSGLKKAWEEAKNMNESITEYLTSNGGKLWEKSDKKRVYVNSLEKLAEIFGFVNPVAYRRQSMYYDVKLDKFVFSGFTSSREKDIPVFVSKIRELSVKK